MSLRKVAFPIDKRNWSPSLIPGVLVLISTYSEGGVPNVAPKSWVQMAAFDPPTLMFSGTKGNTTENNVLAAGGFVVNIVDAVMAPKVYGCLRWHGEERIEKLGLEMAKAGKVDAPVVTDAKAVLECRLSATMEIGSGFILFGEIVSAAIDEDIAKVGLHEKYRLLHQALFMENGLYASVSKVKHVDARPAAAK